MAVLAYKKYQETYMYKERKREFGEKFAMEQYVINGSELKMFYNKLTLRDKLKAFIVPYSCMQLEE